MNWYHLLVDFQGIAIYLVFSYLFSVAYLIKRVGSNPEAARSSLVLVVLVISFILAPALLPIFMGIYIGRSREGGSAE